MGEGIRQIQNHRFWYPVYWGKDIAPVSRIKAHVQDHKGTGNIKLKNIPQIAKKELLFGAILVYCYEAFEKLLYATYKPLIGTGRNGKRSTVIEICK